MRIAKKIYAIDEKIPILIEINEGEKNYDSKMLPSTLLSKNKWIWSYAHAHCINGFMSNEKYSASLSSWHAWKWA